MSPNGWVPNDGIDFFMQFTLRLKERLLRLCDGADKHLAKSMSLPGKCYISFRFISPISPRFANQPGTEYSVLISCIQKGKNPKLTHRLADDAQTWAKLRSILQDQVGVARNFVADYGRRYNANQIPKCLKQSIDEFEVKVNDRISQLDQTVRDLLQIVSI